MITVESVFALLSLINITITFILNGIDKRNGWITSARLLNLITIIIIIFLGFTKAG